MLAPVTRALHPESARAWPPLCDMRQPKFAPVVERFFASFASGHELGAQLAAFERGKKVVDVWGRAHGHSNCAEYDGDTLQNIYSSTKVAAALCINMLVDRGLLRLSDTVASVWPEFAVNGKEAILVSDVLRHEAGLAILVDDEAPLDATKDRTLPIEDLEDLDRLAAVLAASTPFWGEGAYSKLVPHFVCCIPMTTTLGSISGRVVADALDPTSLFRRGHAEDGAEQHRHRAWCPCRTPFRCDAARPSSRGPLGQRTGECAVDCARCGLPRQWRRARRRAHHV